MIHENCNEIEASSQEARNSGKARAPLQANADAERHVLDALAPQVLVQQNVNAHILGACAARHPQNGTLSRTVATRCARTHGLLRELSDLVQSAGCAVLEGAAIATHEARE